MAAAAAAARKYPVPLATFGAFDGIAESEMPNIDQKTAESRARNFMDSQQLSDWYTNRGATFIDESGHSKAHWGASFVTDDEEFAGEVLMVWIEDAPVGLVDFIGPSYSPGDDRLTPVERDASNSDESFESFMDAVRRTFRTPPDE